MEPDMLFDDIARYIAEAQAAVNAGEIEKLDALTGKVDALCQRVIELGDAAFVPKLELLRTQLDALQESMEAAKQDVAEEINASARRQMASRAYRPPEKP